MTTIDAGARGVDSPDDVLNQRDAGGVMQDLGDAGLHPRALPGRHDDDVEAVRAGAVRRLVRTLRRGTCVAVAEELPEGGKLAQGAEVGIL